MAETFSVQTGDFVNVTVTTSCDSFSLEKRFQKSITVDSLKGKLELLTGGSASTMTVKLYDKDDKLVCPLSDNSALLGSFPIDDGMRIHVEDKFLLRKQLEDDSGVRKFELSDEDYTKRTDSLHAYLKKNKLGKYNEEETEKREAERKKEEELDEAKIKTMEIGNRCQVTVPGQPVRRATVMFMGKVNFKPGYWVGIKYDEPLGKNDGSVGGVKYFECPPKYGGFVKPMYIETGDFPEEEINFDDEL